MLPKKQAYQFKDKITVDFLQSSYMDHQQIVEELALSEIHSIELAMPKFNTIACLNKNEFNKLMSNIKRNIKDTHVFMVMVAAISDTFTYMIQNNKFYDNFTSDNKSGLGLLIDLIRTMKHLLVTYRRAVETKHLETLIDILEKSAERIQNEKEHYEIMQQFILSFKTHMQDQLNKENKIEIQKVDIKMECQVKNKVEPNILREDVLKENAKFPPPVFNNKKSNHITSHTNCEMNCVILEDKRNPHLKSQQKQATHVAPLKPQINNKKPTNAFELMMMSSKKLAVKRKGAM